MQGLHRPGTGAQHIRRLHCLRSGSWKTVVCMQLLQGLRRPACRLAFAGNSSVQGATVLQAAFHLGGVALAVHPAITHLSAVPESTATAEPSASLQNDIENRKPATIASKDDWRLSAGSAMIPHPNKRDKGGEDACFVSERFLGVADGVGGWIDSGVDAGIYARQLMQHAQAKSKELEPSKESVYEALEHAQRETRVRGSATACIMCLEGRMLHAANVGDSGFLIVRNGRSIFKTPQQQKRFNFPYQLAHGNDGDHVTCAERFSVGLLKDDIIVAGTDGLWDNAFDDHIAQLASAFQQRGRSPYATAAELSKYAYRISEMPNEITPFAVGARNAGFSFAGGKPDDITVVVAFLQDAPQAKL